METLIGLNALRDEYRRLKLHYGDMKGLGKNKFELGARLGVDEMRIYFNSTSPQRTEIVADVYANSDATDSERYFTMCELIDAVKKYDLNGIEISFIVLQWDKLKINSDSQTVRNVRYLSN